MARLILQKLTHVNCNIDGMARAKSCGEISIYWRGIVTQRYEDGSYNEEFYTGLELIPTIGLDGIDQNLVLPIKWKGHVQWPNQD